MKKADYKKKNNKGFTLVELMVSLSLFAIVMVVAIGSMLSVVEGNKKIQSLQIAMNNLNYSLESMNRTMQTGTGYKKYRVTGGCESIEFRKQLDRVALQGGTVLDEYIIRYFLLNGRIYMNYVIPTGNSSGGAVSFPITAPEIYIEHLCFTPFGTDINDYLQPGVKIVIKGTAKVNQGKLESPFTIHTSVVQRDKE